MKTNYLVGLNKQLQYAVDEGLQEAYEFGVLLEQCLDLVDPGEDDSGAGNEDEHGNTLLDNQDDVDGGDAEPRQQGLQGLDGPAPRSGARVHPAAGDARLRPVLVQRPIDVRDGAMAGAMGRSPKGLASAFAGVKQRGTRTR